jgi:anti-sigma factor RsiW
MKPDNHPDELLAWYANETLELAERAIVDEHLKNCERCRDEVVFLRALRRGVKAVGETNAPGELGLKRLMRDVRARPATERNWWRPALAAAAVVIVVQAALLATFWPRESGITPLGGTKRDGVVQIQFQPTATEAQIRALLQETGATLIDGPGALGVYRIVLDKPDPALTQLRARNDVVKHVAPE